MIFQSILGLGVFLGIAWLFSEGRRRVDFPRVAMGLGLQTALALLLLKLPFFREVFLQLNRLVLALEAGTGLVFGYLGGTPPAFQDSVPGASFIYSRFSRPGHLHHRGACGDILAGCGKTRKEVYFASGGQGRTPCTPQGSFAPLTPDKVLFQSVVGFPTSKPNAERGV